MHTAFIIYENALFARGLERLLEEEGVDVVGIAAPDKQGIERMKNLGPDIVIAEIEEREPAKGLLLARLLRQASRAALVQISLKNNSATLYTGHRWTAHTPHELVKEIMSSLASWKGGHEHVPT
jgi:DNA-binding NarL/FixJ family response regulator